MSADFYSDLKAASEAARQMAICNSVSTKVVRSDNGWLVCPLSESDPIVQKIDSTPTPVPKPQVKSNPQPNMPIYKPTFVRGASRGNYNTEHQNDSSDEEIDAKDLQDRVNDYWDEIGSSREDYARSNNEGWYHPESEGSHEDNYSEDY